MRWASYRNGDGTSGSGTSGGRDTKEGESGQRDILVRGAAAAVCSLVA